MKETDMIRWIRRMWPPQGGLRRGIGDDAAVIRHRAGTEWIVTTDMIAEGTHFTRRDSGPAAWGRKVVMCGVSDVAAMGGRPKFAFSSLGLPGRFRSKDFRAMQNGINGACRKYGIVLAGGDIVRSRSVVLSMTMIGTVRFGGAILRDGARPGDIVFVTGPLGGSLGSGHHLTFTPRLRESMFLVRNYRPSAMIDLSDGLSKDLGLMARESRVGFRLIEYAIPLRRGVRDIDRAFLDGEDFELLFTLKPDRAAALLRDSRPNRSGMAFFPIGSAVARSQGVYLADVRGRRRPIPVLRDHHFDVSDSGYKGKRA